MGTFSKPELIRLTKIADPRGNLSVIQENDTVPFDISRIFYLYDVPADSSRGGHAHHADNQFMIALSGSFDVVLDNGVETQRYTLNRPYIGLLIPPGYWRTMDNFSAGSVCMVITDRPYNETDYIRDYEEFKTLMSSNPKPF